MAVAPFPTPVLPVRVTIGGADAEILYAGRAPGFAGLIQINARVGNLTGLDLALLVLVGDNASQPGLTLTVVAQ